MFVYGRSLPEMDQRLILRHAMRPTIEVTLNRGVVVPPHRLRRYQVLHHPTINFTIMIPSAAQIYEHVSVLLVVADPLNEAAAGDRVTLECREAHRPAIFDRNDLGFCCGQPRLGLSGFSGLLVELIVWVALYWGQLRLARTL